MHPLAYREYEPSRPLAPYVRACFTLGPAPEIAQGFALRRRVSFADASDMSPRMMADVAASIVVKSDDVWSVDGVDEAGPVAAATLFGPMPQGHVTRIGAGIRAVGIYFHVGALGQFFPLPVGELVGGGLPMGELLNAADRAAMAMTFETLDPGARLRILEGVLIRRIRNVRLATYDLARRFYQHCLHGQQSIEGIALELGVSRQYLARQLHLAVGIPPKLVARIARFQNVLKTLTASSAAWADVAVDFGYCDQSHLIADFRDFAATSPAALVRAQQFHPHCL